MAQEARGKKPNSKFLHPQSLPEHYFPFSKFHCYGIIILLSFVLYSNTLWNKYALDDAIVITQNDFTKQGFSGIGKLLTTDVFLGFFKTEKNLVAGGRYRPLSVVTFAIEYELFGENPAVSHFFNIVLYGLTGIVLFVFLTRLMLMKPTKYSGLIYLPLLTSLLFIAHPIHTEAVANIKGRDEIMTLLFAIVAANSFLKYYDERKVKTLVSGSVWFFLALLSKENAITWLAIFPLLLYFFRPWQKTNVAYVSGAAFMVAAIYLVLRQTFTNTSLDKEVTELMNNPFVGATDEQKFTTIIYTWGKYLWLLIFPHPLSHDYYPHQIPWKNFSHIGFIVSAFVYIGLGGLAVYGFLKKHLYSFCILYFIITFSVVSNLLFPVGTTMSERFVYMSSVSFCLFVAYLVHQIPVRKGKLERDSTLYRTAMALTMVILLGYSVKTIARNPAWKDNYTLFSTDIRYSPNSAKLNNALGGTSLEFLDKPGVTPPEKRFYADQAKSVLARAIEIHPKFTNAYLLMGNAYLKGDSNFVMAAKYYAQCLTINPNYRDAITNLGVALHKINDADQRLAVLNEALHSSPANFRLLYHRGLAERNASQYATAIESFRKAIQVKPDYGEAYNQMGLTFGQNLNQIDSSIIYLHKAVSVDPSLVDAHDNLATAYGIKGEFQKAIDVLNYAISLRPDHTKYYSTMAVTYRAMGNMNKANEYFSRAQQFQGKTYNR